MVADSKKLPNSSLGANADLILLQEVDKHARRTDVRNIAEISRTETEIVLCVRHRVSGVSAGLPRCARASRPGDSLALAALRLPCTAIFQEQSTYWHPEWWIPITAAVSEKAGWAYGAPKSRAKIGQTTLAVYNLHLESRGGDDLRRSQLVRC